MLTEIQGRKVPVLASVKNGNHLGFADELKNLALTLNAPQQVAGAISISAAVTEPLSGAPAKRFGCAPFLDHGPIKDHDLTFRFVNDFIAKSNSAFDDDLLNVFARSKSVSEFSIIAAVQQALIFRRVHANVSSVRGCPNGDSARPEQLRTEPS